MAHENGMGLQLRSLITAEGELQLSLVERPIPEPAADEVVVRMEATPINPSDIGLLCGPADMSRAVAGGTPDRPTITAPIAPKHLASVSARVGQSMPVGNEGAGVVVRAGGEAQALLGKAVAIANGGAYCQYRLARAADCVALPQGATAAEAAAWFINPMTALGMVETMRQEGHTALVHTAAASNLGQMLNRLCLADGIGLVNVVRRPEQAHMLRAAGAQHVVVSSAPSYEAALTDAIAAVGATLAFDAIGGDGGPSTILNAMEAVQSRQATAFSRYGSAVHKQVYVYGVLDPGPITLHRGFGFAWGVGGWLVTNFLGRIGPERTQALKERVMAELKTTFASRYTREITLAEALDPEILAAYYRRATGEKYLINPAG